MQMMVGDHFFPLSLSKLKGGFIKLLFLLRFRDMVIKEEMEEL